jgi:two-component sensor histidine kinase
MLRYQQQYSCFDESKLGKAVRFINLSDVVREKDLDAVLAAFALLLHELATYATTRGALSRPAAPVSIQWGIDGAGKEAAFRFKWKERDRPLVKLPTRKALAACSARKGCCEGL